MKITTGKHKSPRATVVLHHKSPRATVAFRHMYGGHDTEKEFKEFSAQEAEDSVRALNDSYRSYIKLLAGKQTGAFK